MGTDVLYGFERIDFRSGMSGNTMDLSPQVYRDWNTGKIMDFWGTEFGDIFNGDDYGTLIDARGGDDWILAGNGDDRINPGGGADYVNAGLNELDGEDSPWYRDEVFFNNVSYGRTEVAQVKVQVHSTNGPGGEKGDLLVDSTTGQFKIYNYSGIAAWAEDYEEYVIIDETVSVFDATTDDASGNYEWVDVS